MSHFTSTITATEVVSSAANACGIDALPGQELSAASTPDQLTPSRRQRLVRAAERGMVTAEYAVGILAAVALALVLLKVFHDNSIFTALLHYVTQLIGQLSSYIK